MTYPSIKETFYRGRPGKSVVLTVPHGGDAVDFLKFFPEIKRDAELEKVWPIFETYLAIERDSGATELAHAIAYELSRSSVESRVVELNYPRGIVDGGRLRDHCLRACLPHTLGEKLKKPFLQLHETSLRYMDNLYRDMAKEKAAYLLDVHTMASFCPVDDSGKRSTFPVSFPRLEHYVNQYVNARNHAYQRKIDLICSDEQGRKLADPKLLSAIRKQLDVAGYACLENEPYHAAPVYLSYQHMQMVPSLSIDVPKHLIAKGDLSFELDRVEIDADGVKRLGQVLAQGLYEAFEDDS